MNKITFYEALKRAAKAVIDKDVQAFLADDAVGEADEREEQRLLYRQQGRADQPRE